MLERGDYSKCIDYIEDYWDELTFLLSEDEGVHIALPNKAVSPNTHIFRNDQFYWDGLFIIFGLLDSGRVALARGMVDNLIFLYRRFGIIPARNRVYNLGVSQPPFLTSMARSVFEEENDLEWLEDVFEVAEKELDEYWQRKSIDTAEAHLVYAGLSRYCDHFVTHSTAENESGWDMTSRFKEHCLNFLPIDLNCLLYKYEKDIAWASSLLGERKKEMEFLGKAEERKKSINDLLWNEKKGFFFDYDFVNKEQSDFFSVAGFYPLWTGLASEEQAERLRNNLELFEFEGGLANTQKECLCEEFKQHDYPNGWPHQQLIVIEGLLNYGFRNDAERIAKKWLDLNKKVFLETGEFWEKYDVVKCLVGKPARYPTQKGFGWTNGVFIRLLEEFSV